MAKTTYKITYKIRKSALTKEFTVKATDENDAKVKLFSMLGSAAETCTIIQIIQK